MDICILHPDLLQLTMDDGFKKRNTESVCGEERRFPYPQPENLGRPRQYRVFAVWQHANVTGLNGIRPCPRKSIVVPANGTYTLSPEEKVSRGWVDFSFRIGNAKRVASSSDPIAVSDTPRLLAALTATDRSLPFNLQLS